MLCEEEIEMLEQVLGSDRLQKQLLNELLGSFVEDPNGITVETFDVFVELCSVINYTPKVSTVIPLGNIRVRSIAFNAERSRVFRIDWYNRDMATFLNEYRY